MSAYGVAAGLGRVVQSGLILYLDAGNSKSIVSGSTTWTDISRNGNNGTLTNGAFFSGSNGGIVVFDGTDDYVAGPTFTGLGSSNRTADVWFQIRSLPASAISKRIFTLSADNSSTDTPALLFSYSNTLSSLTAGFGGSPYNGYVGVNFTLSTWINLTATITGNNISAYKNGILVGSTTNSGGVGANPILSIGRYNQFYGQYADAIISNFKIYNRALSATEVLQNYNMEKKRFGLS
jgi:hypothetical protein